jgi:predicted amidohydrolase YtcJ
MSHQVLLTGADLFPLGSVPPGADALLVQDGHIAAMGKEAELSRHLSPQARTIDLAGKVILPGFFDTHVHLAETGLLGQRLDLSPAETIQQVLGLLAQAFPQRSSSRLFQAHSLDPSQLEERRYPHREELDAISSQVPIFILRRDGHSCAVNSAFWEHCGLTEDVPGVEVDRQSGRPTGTLRARALEVAQEHRVQLMEEEDRGQAIRRACWQAARKGVTTVHAICTRPEDLDILADLADELPVDVVPYLNTTDVDEIQRRGLGQIGGDLLTDGSLGSHTAALSQPYADRPKERGLLYHQREQTVDFVTRAHRAGLQVAIHAIGDRAVERVLSVYETVLDRYPREDHRHRIEHAELLTAEQIKRLGDRGVVLAVQPAFEAFWGGPGGMYERRLGPQRVKQTNPFRPLLDAGVIIAGGSDSYITPIDPLAGMAAAVNHPSPHHRVSPLEAARMFTFNGAYLAFQEGQKGLLHQGMRADLVILSADPRSVLPEDISQIQISMVIKDGKIVVGPKQADDPSKEEKK